LVKNQRKIAVVTGTRAEFGLLEPVMRAIAAQRSLQLQVVVAGMHLVNDTWHDVRDAGFAIDARVPMQRKDATGRLADVKALAQGVEGFGLAFADLDPHAVLVLGDRVEVMAAALAASIGGRHLAHIHGGDRAEGVADEAMRHATSKLAHLHFAATARSARRLVRMGEDRDCVLRVGSPAMDQLRDVHPAADAPQLIVLQHPIGADDPAEARWMRQTLEATHRYDRLVLAPNHDPGSAGIRRAIREAGIKPVEHLPRAQWLATLAGAQVIVGNSSAGLIEAAALKTACVNIGPRQGGREKPRHVIDCDYGSQKVATAIRRALKLDLRRLRHPYGDGHASQRIASHLAKVNLARIPRRKQNSY
jgi:UDP-hydrolysing UDP-N-acetyl-D-glucosamine 2-epimerase